MLVKEWRDVVGDDTYEISNHGDIRRKSTGKILKPGRHPCGYLTVRRINPKASRTLHRLVAKAFIPNPLDLPWVNHLNGIKTDNRVDNLEWCDASRNTTHAIANGLNKSRGATHHCAKLTEKDVLHIFSLFKQGKTLKKIADEVGTTLSNVSSIVRGKSWKYLNLNIS